MTPNSDVTTIQPGGKRDLREELMARSNRYDYYTHKLHTHTRECAHTHTHVDGE